MVATGDNNGAGGEMVGKVGKGPSESPTRTIPRKSKRRPRFLPAAPLATTAAAAKAAQREPYHQFELLKLEAVGHAKSSAALASIELSQRGTEGDGALEGEGGSSDAHPLGRSAFICSMQDASVMDAANALAQKGREDGVLAAAALWRLDQLASGADRTPSPLGEAKRGDAHGDHGSGSPAIRAFGEGLARSLVEDALGAMRSHVNLERVQAAGCSLISRLCVDDPIRQATAKAGAFTTIANALQAHKSAAVVHTWAAVLVLNLTHDSVLRAQLAIVAGVITSLQRVCRHAKQAGGTYDTPRAVAGKRLELTLRWLLMHAQILHIELSKDGAPLRFIAKSPTSVNEGPEPAASKLAGDGYAEAEVTGAEGEEGFSKRDATCQIM
jgi:hypothetical protein